MIHFVAKFVAQSLCFKFANTQNTQTDAETEKSIKTNTNWNIIQ